MHVTATPQVTAPNRAERAPPAVTAVVINHPLLALTAAFLVGFLAEWLLELIFFRRRLFDTESALRRREREVADLRFEAARADERLKNRELELEATQKARQTGETKIALGRQEVEHLKNELRLAEGALLREVVCRTEAESAISRESSVGEGLRRSIAFLEADITRLSAAVVASAADAAIAAASAATATEANRSLRSNLAAQGSDLSAAVQRAETAEKALAAAGSVQLNLMDSLRGRDQQLTGMAADLAGKEDERAALSRALATADERSTALAAQVRQLKEDGDQIFNELQALRSQSVAGATKLDDAIRARAEANAALKKAESEASELGRRAAEYQLALEAAAKENTRLTQESARLGAQIMAADAARKHTESEKLRLQQEIKSLEATESAGREELISLRARLRDRETELESSYTVKLALESELQAVSASHARLEVELASAKTVTPVQAELFPDGPAAGEVPLAPAEAVVPAPAPAPVEEVNRIVEYTVDCPQRLGEIDGLTPPLVARLYAAGIGSFWQFAHADRDRLAGILETDLEELTVFNFEAMCAEAERKARETDSIGRKWSGEAPDDLTMIDGLGTGHQRQLADAGICTFAALGRANPDLLARICKSAAGREINYTTWIEQARMLAEVDSV